MPASREASSALMNSLQRVVAPRGVVAGPVSACRTADHDRCLWADILETGLPAEREASAPTSRHQRTNKRDAPVKIPTRYTSNTVPELLPRGDWVKHSSTYRLVQGSELGIPPPLACATPTTSPKTGAAQ